MNAGDTVEDFELPDETGTPRKLSEFLAHGPVVLFFYPAAMTRGCTAEACHFRDLAAEFAELSAQRVGISTDEVAAQQRFTGAHDLGYPLLSDVGGAVSSRFGVHRGLGPDAHQAPDVRHRHGLPRARRRQVGGPHGRPRRQGAGDPSLRRPVLAG
ncbi:peroxiredoxin [Nonomuraea sp. NPDC050556]|uniref:peroxiredoxin n=1 Tax=Nonomuraea sp. NPDC050556 TaxID=3364369 RepID=UPI00379E1D3B